METRLAISLILFGLMTMTSSYPYHHLRNMRNRRIPNPRQLYKSQDMLIRGRRGKTTEDREISYLGQNPFQNSAGSSSYGYRAPQVPLRPVDVEPSADQAFQSAAGGGYLPASSTSGSSAQRPDALVPEGIRPQESDPVVPQPPQSPRVSVSDSLAASQDHTTSCNQNQCVEPSNCLNVTVSEGECCPTCATYGCICEGFHQRYDCEQNGYSDGKVPEGESYAVDSGSTICKCPKGGGTIMCSFGDVPFGPISAPKIICPQTPIYCINTFTNADGCVECLGLGCIEEDGKKHEGGSKVEKPNCQVCYCPAEGGSLLCTDDRNCIASNQDPPQTSLALEATQRVLRDPIQEEGRLPDSRYGGNQYQEQPGVYRSNTNLDKLGYDTTLLQPDWNKFGSPSRGFREPSSNSDTASSSSTSDGDNVVVPPLVSPDATASQDPSGTNQDSATAYGNPGDQTGIGGAGGYGGYNFPQQPYPKIGYQNFPGYGANGGRNSGGSSPEETGSQSRSGSPSLNNNQGSFPNTGLLPPYQNYNQQYPGYYNNPNYLGGLQRKPSNAAEPAAGIGDESPGQTKPQGNVGVGGLGGYNVNGQYGYGYYGQGYNQFYGNQFQGNRNGFIPGQYGVGQRMAGAGDAYGAGGSNENDNADGSDLSRATRLTSVDRHGLGGFYRPAGGESATGDAVSGAKQNLETPVKTSGSSSEGLETADQNDADSDSDTEVSPSDKPVVADADAGGDESDPLSPNIPARPDSYLKYGYQHPYGHSNTLNTLGVDETPEQLPPSKLRQNIQYPYPNQYMYPQQPFPKYPGVGGLGNQGVSGTGSNNYPNVGLGLTGDRSNTEQSGPGLSPANDEETNVGNSGLAGDGAVGDAAASLDSQSVSGKKQRPQGVESGLNGATGQVANVLPNLGVNGYQNPLLGGYPNPNGYVNQAGYNYPMQPQNPYLNGYQGGMLYPGKQQLPYGPGLGVYNPAGPFAGPNAIPNNPLQPSENQTNFHSPGQGGLLVRPSLTPVLPSIVPLMSSTFLSPTRNLFQPIRPTTNYVHPNPNATRFENVLSACCVEGNQWALDHDTCAGIRVTVDTYSQICAVAQEKCCMQAKNQESCQQGIETARSMAACDVPSHLAGQCKSDGFKPCCDCCALGLKAFGLSLSCDMEILGQPCNSAYSECCRKGRLITDHGPGATGIDNNNNNNNNLPFVPPSAVSPTLSSAVDNTGINGRRCLVANDCEHLCHNTADGIECACREGYQLNQDGRSCDDINECVIGSHTCLESQICFNTIGRFNCQRRISCGTGYELTEQNTCDDIDECALRLHNCGAKLDCVNMRGSFRCVAKVCGTGYITDATGSCIDIDECRAGDYSCPPRSRCTNTVGSYSCLCIEGFVFNKDAQICEDLNECELGISNCQAGSTCINTNGSFTCVEPPTLSCDPGYQPNDAESDCIDVNECETGSHTCADGSTCINEIGSFRCQDPIRCNEGTRPSPNKRSCVDINECEEGDLNRCGDGGVCLNLPGSYRCECVRGYQKGNSSNGLETCEDIDECSLSLGRHCKYRCQNTPGSFSCVCPDGYTLSKYGRTCQDIDECGLETHNCSDSDTCFNTRGGFKCVELTCPKDYAPHINRQGNILKCMDRSGCHHANCIRLYTYLHVSLPSVLKLLNPVLLIRLRKVPSARDFSASIVYGNEANKFILQSRPNGYLASLSLKAAVQGPWTTVLRIDVTETGTWGSRMKKVVIVYVYVSQYEF